MEQGKQTISNGICAIKLKGEIAFGNAVKIQAEQTRL
jgi:hypothetical protein